MGVGGAGRRNKLQQILQKTLTCQVYYTQAQPFDETTGSLGTSACRQHSVVGVCVRVCVCRQLKVSNQYSRSMAYARRTRRNKRTNIFGRRVE